MKNLFRSALLALAIYCLSGCASTSSTAAGDPVPGEKTGEESRLAPGTAPGANASVKW